MERVGIHLRPSKPTLAGSIEWQPVLRLAAAAVLVRRLACCRLFLGILWLPTAAAVREA